MILKTLSELSMQDVRALQSGEVREGREIEYKSRLPEATSDSKKEFLADVSSFANAEGGDLIFGVVEDGGIPADIAGIPIDDIDSTIQRLENLIRDGIEPRINETIKVVREETLAVLIMRIPKSWNKPHRVIFGGHDKFYSRNSAGKYPLDVEELRQSFVGSMSAITEMRKFSLERSLALLEDDGMVKLGDSGKMSLLLLPLESFSSESIRDLNSVKIDELPPLVSLSGWNDLINLEGYLTYAQGAGGATVSYTQLYRNGVLETVDTSVFWTIDQGKYAFFPNDIEKAIMDRLPKYLALYEKIGITPPIGIGLSFIGIKDYPLIYPAVGYTRSIRQRPFPKDILKLPVQVLTEPNKDIGHWMRPLFDLIWNAYGIKRSPNYDVAGIWKPPA